MLGIQLRVSFRGGGARGNLPPLERSVPPLESVRLKAKLSKMLLILQEN